MNFKKVFSLIVMIIFLFGCQSVNPVLEIHIIDVGQGDSILIKTPQNKTILIDAGDEKSDYLVINYLNKQQIKEIDILIASHFDSDHIGGLDNVIDNFSVKSVYAPDDNYDTSSFNNFFLACEKKDLSIQTIKRGDFIEVEKDITLNILSPNIITSNSNANSIVLSFDFINKSFLFTGDMEKSNELELINSSLIENINFLKVSHHGSYTATSEEFISYITPDVSVISCGYKNSYGHPHRSVLETLEKHNSLIYRTDISGNLVFYSDGDIIYTKDDYLKK